jgi:hypothetical protein
MSGNGRLSFLVVGTARSGTTLVQRLCCELPGVWVPMETHFWSVADRARFRFDFPLRGDDRDRMVEWVLHELAAKALPARNARIVKQISQRERRVGLWTVFESLVADLSPPDRRVLGEKTPNHLFWWEHFARAQPDLKLLALVRDPRAVLRSQRGVLWGERSAHALAERWLAHQRAIVDARRLLGPERMLTIRYEDLVDDPAGHQEGIAKFLGVPFSPKPLKDALVAEHPLFPEREQWKDNAMRAVTADRKTTWRDELTDEDVAVVEAACGDLMHVFGYERAAAALPPEPDTAARDAITAFRSWHAQVAGLSGLPVY